MARKVPFNRVARPIARAAGPWPVVAVSVLAAVVAAGAGRGRAAQGLDQVLDSEARQHYEQGEVRYQNKWVSVEELHGQIQALEKQMAPLLDKGKEIRQRLYLIGREITQLRNEQRSRQFPLHRERTDLFRQKARFEAVLRQRPPQPPRLLVEPKRPSRRAFGHTTNDDYDRRVRNWERERERIRRENEHRKEEYEEKVNELGEAQKKAKEEIRKLQQQIDEIDKKLEAVQEEFDAKVAPLDEKRKAVEGELQDLRSEAASLLRRRQLIEEALDQAPPEVMWKLDLIAWDGTYRRLADLETEYEKTAAEIAEVRQELQSAAERAGREFPSDWRHPGQDKMDRLKALIERVKAALGK